MLCAHSGSRSCTLAGLVVLAVAVAVCVCVGGEGMCVCGGVSLDVNPIGIAGTRVVHCCQVSGTSTEQTFCGGLFTGMPFLDASHLVYIYYTFGSK